MFLSHINTLNHHMTRVKHTQHCATLAFVPVSYTHLHYHLTLFNYFTRNVIRALVKS